MPMSYLTDRRHVCRLGSRQFGDSVREVKAVDFLLTHLAHACNK